MSSDLAVDVDCTPVHVFLQLGFSKWNNFSFAMTVRCKKDVFSYILGKETIMSGNAFYLEQKKNKNIFVENIFALWYIFLQVTIVARCPRYKNKKHRFRLLFRPYGVLPISFSIRCFIPAHLYSFNFSCLFFTSQWIVTLQRHF